MGTGRAGVALVGLPPHNPTTPSRKTAMPKVTQAKSRVSMRARRCVSHVSYHVATVINGILDDYELRGVEVPFVPGHFLHEKVRCSLTDALRMYPELHFNKSIIRNHLCAFLPKGFTAKNLTEEDRKRSLSEFASNCRNPRNARYYRLSRIPFDDSLPRSRSSSPCCERDDFSDLMSALSSIPCASSLDLSKSADSENDEQDDGVLDLSLNIDDFSPTPINELEDVINTLCSDEILDASECVAGLVSLPDFSADDAASILGSDNDETLSSLADAIPALIMQ